MAIQKIELIGSGGFGTVYRAMIDGIGDIVALKELNFSLPNSEEHRRFKREVHILSRLNHQNIVPVLKCDLDVSPPWFAMPLANSSLQDEIDTLSFELERLDMLFRQILDGIKYAHSQGVIHRDLKPQNILLFNDKACIADFGLGKEFDRQTRTTTLTTSQQFLGTIVYAAPEQMRPARSVDRRADIYSIGKMLYECLTTEEPFPQMDYQLVADPYRYIVTKCTENDPERRFQTVDEIITAFDNKDEAELFLPRRGRAKLRLDALFNNTPTNEAVRELNKILMENSQYEDLYLENFWKLNKDWISIYWNTEREGFKNVLEQYDEYVSGSLGFEYCDKVADVYELVFNAIDDTHIRTLILTRLLLMGVSHNRWHVQDVFSDLLGSIRSHTMAHIAVEIIRDYPQEIAYLAEKILVRDPIEVIEKAVLDITPNQSDHVSGFEFPF